MCVVHIVWAGRVYFAGSVDSSVDLVERSANILHWLITLWAGSCLSADPTIQLSARSPSSPSTTRSIAEIWASAGVEYNNTDSLAACRCGDGKVRVFATAKEGHRLDIFDAATGRFDRSTGSKGSRAGQFNYPNGIVTLELGADDVDAGSVRTFILVIERDNARVQAIDPDTGRSMGVFGETQLNRPYGGAICQHGAETWLYVTDTEVAPERTVHQYRLRLQDGRLVAEYVRHFGDREAPGRIIEAESIVVDAQAKHVLLCDEGGEPPELPNGEDGAWPTAERLKRVMVRVYTLEGKFTGTCFGAGLVRGDPEGIVLLDRPGKGIVLLTDQEDHLSTWHVFDRGTYEYRGSFTGEPRVANTDGICVYTKPFGRFRGGALFAVDDDEDIRAYDLADVIAVVEQMKPDARER